jgi:hypothetical protein
LRLRWGILICLLLALTGVVSVYAEEADQAKLRPWYLGVQANGGGRDQWNVFGQEDQPPTAVDNDGGGGGFLFGYRFGGRFLLGLQLAVTSHDLIGVPEKLYDVEALITGTVLFRERSTFQPFFRGGFGAGSVVLEKPGGDGNMTSLGTSTILGGGFQIRLSSRFSLEYEIVGTFTNYLEVYDSTGGDGPVKTSNMGLRNGIGLYIWF